MSSPRDRPEDVYGERSNRRLVLVVRVLLVCSSVSAFLPLPELGMGEPLATTARLAIASLVLLSAAYVGALGAARRQRWTLARSLLFGAWTLYPGGLVLVYRAEMEAVAQLLTLGVANLFAVLVIVGMLALAPWRQARPWIALLIGFVVAAYGWILAAYDHESLQGFATFAGVSVVLLAASVLPLWAILTDLDLALGESEEARLEAHAMREEASLARDQALAARTAKSRFLANMSHELRTPLNAILGYAELVLDEAHDEGLHAFDTDLGRIHHAGSHLLGLINAILDLSKIEAGKTEVQRAPFDVEALAFEVVATIQPLADAKSLEVEVVGEVPAVVVSDGAKVRQVLLNLLSNAVKYTDAGWVRLEAERVGDELVLRVSDSGVGIDPARLRAVFEVFERTEAEVTQRVGGTGLGLAISRRLCELLGGSLTVASEVGRGSVFTVRLPASE